jgi:hypothetical protein
MNPNNYTVTAGVYGSAKTLQTGFSSSKGPLNMGGVFEGYGVAANVGVMGRISKSLPVPVVIGPNRFAIGGAFMSDTSTTNPFFGGVVNIGVFGRGSKSLVSNIGAYAEAQSSSGPDYGVYAIGPPGGGPGPDYAGYFAGDLGYTGAFGFVSDVNLKTNIDTIQNALGKINALKPKQFDFNTGAYPNMHLSQGLQYGLIAQDVQTVIPAIVTDNIFPAAYDDNGNQLSPAVNYKGLEYTQLIPIMIKAMQQQQSQIRKQDSLIQVLSQAQQTCCNNNQNNQDRITNGNSLNNNNQLNIELNDDVIVLNQNQPNPFAEKCIITYNVPDKYNFAQIIFKTNDGRIIRTVDVTKKGRGQINVFAGDLSSGTYIYTLIVDGNVIDTRKMVKE